MRSCAAIAAANTVLTTAASSDAAWSVTACSTRSIVPRQLSVRFDVRHELFLRHLQRLVRLYRHLDLDGIILAERIPFPVVRHQDPAHVRITAETNPEQIVSLALGPARGRPHARH